MSSTAFHDSGSLWFYGIPWTIMQMESALANAEPTTDSDELELRERAVAKPDPDQPGAPDLFRWASEAVGAIINRSPAGFITALCKDPSKTYLIDVLVLRKKRGNSERDLNGSPDLLERRVPTDAQVEELKRKGWDVNWYKEAIQ